MNIDKIEKLVVYLPNELGGKDSKTGEGTIRYKPENVVCVIDPSHKGKCVSQVLNFGGEIPIVGSVEESLKYKGEALVLGCAFRGGKLPDNWRKDILFALENGLDIINGLHDFLCDDKDISQAAEKFNRQLLDLRRPPDYFEVATGKAAYVKANTVLTVGTDCNVGKMTTQMELLKECQKRGHRSRAVATGQTGIIVCGQGVVIDRVIGDFMAGVVEKEVIKASLDTDYVFIEGQGSICHPGYSGVTLSLLHGAAPKCMILCQRAGKTRIGDMDIDIPPISSLIENYERLAGFIRSSKIVAIALDTRKLKEEEARELIERYISLTGLPTTDPVRFGASVLMDGIEQFCSRLDEQEQPINS